ncbi:nuclear transport factor 2 family protein [Sphingopyxis fribergensis]
MPTREQMIATIEGAYTARVAGDVAKMNAIWAEGATYAMEGEAALMARYPTGPTEALAATRRLADLLDADELERIDTIVDGNRVAVQWRARFSKGDRSRVLNLFSRWEFDDAGRVVSLHEYGDTAMIAEMIGG